MLDEVLLAALLIGWAAVLLPSALRSRRSADPIVTVGGFTEAMAVLRGRPSGREIMVPGQADRIVGHGPSAPARPPRGARVSTSPSRRRLLQRRRSLFVRLLVATGVTFVLAMTVGGLLWPLFLTSALGLFGYVALLRHYKVERDEARLVVRSMQSAAAPRSEVVEPFGTAAPDDAPRRGWQPVREPVAVGAEGFSVPVASGSDPAWEPQSSVRIRRWET